MSSDEIRTQRPRRPSAGYALRVAVPPARAGDAASMDALLGALVSCGAEIRSDQLVGELREIEVACAGDDEQRSVREVTAAHGADVFDATFALHRGGKLAITPRTPVGGPAELAMAYTPGVGRVSQAIADDAAAVWSLTGRGNAVAVLTNGTAVLGLGDIGPEAALPVMEGKAILFKQFGGVDAYPVCVAASTVDEMVTIGRAIAPTFGGINLEDIAAPACFAIERRLQAELDIPVFHDDQHGTAIVVLAALHNAAAVVGKRLEELVVTIVGTGAAGVACAELLSHVGVEDIIGVDRAGTLDRERTGLPPHKQWFVESGNRRDRNGGVHEALKGADVLLGLSGPGIVDPAWLGDMADDAIVFALANPVPEVMPEDVPANIAVMATGRSDYPNQINNVLAFPGVFRGMLDVAATACTVKMKLAAAEALAALAPSPDPDRIVPTAFDAGVADTVAHAVASTARATGRVRARC